MVFDVFFLLLKNLIGRPSSVNDIGIASSKHAGTCNILGKQFCRALCLVLLVHTPEIALEKTIPGNDTSYSSLGSYYIQYTVSHMTMEPYPDSSDAHWMNCQN